jgi:hypothetical protein
VTRIELLVAAYESDTAAAVQLQRKTNLLRIYRSEAKQRRARLVRMLGR